MPALFATPGGSAHLTHSIYSITRVDVHMGERYFTLSVPLAV